MARDTFECCGETVPAEDKETVITCMKEYYDSKMKAYHIVAYFDYEPDGLKDIFPLCQSETLESITNRYRNYKPKEGRKCDIREDRESLIFPKYSIVDCSMKPSYKLSRRALEMFVEEAASRFIIFTNYNNRKAIRNCGGGGHARFCSNDRHEAIA